MEPLRCSEVDYETIDIEKETGIVGASTIKLNLPPITDEEFPTVSVVVPTYNRHYFSELIIRNWERIDYPREKLELIILDDSNIDHPEPEIFNKEGIRYEKIRDKLTIGEKRNVLCSLANNEYIVHMDDDDWYPAESVAARIRILLEFEKNTKKLGCFGCNKVLCMDLVTNQMFESFDKSSDIDIPATLSESTMVYSKKYWEDQGWNNESVFAECLPFLQDRHDTVCTGPSVFVVTQFTHGKNTVDRRVEINQVSEFNAVRFQNSLSAYDSRIFNNIRAKVIRKVPGYKEAIEFVQKCQNLKQPKLKKLLKKTDEKILKNPLVIEMMRERLVDKFSTTGKDVVYYCGPGEYLNFSNTWNPQSKSLGGSEEAVINLSNEMSRNGYNVTVYCVLDGPSKTYLGPNGEKVHYKKYWNWVPNNAQDVTIIWRDPSNCKYPLENSKQVLLDLHDALDSEWLKGVPEKVKIMSKSEYHRKILKVPGSFVVPNGIHPVKVGEKVRNLLVCTSSPDRCLRSLLRAMPIIRKSIPDAEIHWAYGFSSGISEGGMEKHVRDDVREWVKNSKEMIENCEGFVDLGRLSQGEVNDLYSKADFFIYATRFPEIDCISLTKAMSAGAIPMVTPSGAISEKMGIRRGQVAKNGVYGIDSSLEDGEYFNKFVEAVVNSLKQKEREREDIIKYANNNYNWGSIGKTWIQIINK